MSIVLSLILWFFFALNSLMLFRGPSGYVTLTWIFLAFLFFKKYGLHSFALLFGFSIPLAPLLGPTTLIPITFSFLIVSRRNIDPLYLKAWAPWLWILLCWAMLWSFLEFDPEIIERFYRAGDLGNLLPAPTPLTRNALEKVSLWLALVGVFSVLVSNPDIRSQVSKGLIYSIGPVFIIALLQKISFNFAQCFPAFNPYWQTLSRIPSTLSDPNALGIWAFLIIHIIFQKITNKNLVLALILPVAWLGLISGSRTFLLGILFSLLQFLAPKKIWIASAGVAAVLAVGLATYLDSSGLLRTLLDHPAVPSGVTRFAESLAYGRLSVTLESRTIFSQICFLIWSRFPIIGSGLGSFPFELPSAAAHLGVLSHGWSDNANSFYLGILSELGILGLLILILVSLRFRITPEGTCARFGTYSFLGLLFFGPHLDFPEVALSFALLASSAVTLTPVKTTPPFTWIFASFACISALARVSSNFGFYLPEFRDGRWYAWSARRAQLSVPCPSSTCTVQLSSPLARPDSPITVRVTSEGMAPVKVILRGTGLADFTYKIPDSEMWYESDKRYRKSFSLEVDPVTKLGSGEAGDTRSLGVQVTLP